jgi:hypothetical protein
MKPSPLSRVALSVLIALSLARQVCAAQEGGKETIQTAALGLPTGPSADWRQWDSFLTNVVKKLAEEMSPGLRDQLAETFLDSRYSLARALGAGSSDPVPQLLTETWNRLSPIMKQAVSGASQQTAGQYAGFIRAMDSATSLSGIGQTLGLFRVTPDALNGAARLLGAGGADPLAYVLDVDTGLRTLLGLPGALPSFRPSPSLEQSRLQRLRERAAGAERWFYVRSAHAAESDFDRLNEWVPERQEVPDYLLEVRKLLAETSDHVLAKSSLAQEHRPFYRQIVFATSWQESCWRQFIKKGEKLAPLASSTGDVGLMQVNRVTWRSIYDIKGLNGDMSYNGNAGAEILHHYLTRYAIPKKEDKQPRGHLARATYSAYNAGPGGLARYRGVRQTATWKKVDEAFWAKFKAVSSGQELAVKSCFVS